MSIPAMQGGQLLCMQKEQFRHDKRNHSDILSLHKTDRLKHYGLHYCKYVGRLARGTSEPKSIERTLTDALLVCLSAANTLHQKLEPTQRIDMFCNDSFFAFAEASGRFADACEKIDHLEEFVNMAKVANQNVLFSILLFAKSSNTDPVSTIAARRAELAERHFYSDDII